ncbi:adrenodoxin-like protein 1, mitochondrial [Stegodyphus dumicola]|uniref:adrenodoxin-like protein 1, mitochondrial n=1 Tax=Stegodyphus dumicola TaxID=202533 RepID=UPI0015AA640F|nr:adrenodoxin-like protein 1, mitochondrial [Stegodyphus dumicola]
MFSRSPFSAFRYPYHSMFRTFKYRHFYSHPKAFSFLKNFYFGKHFLSTIYSQERASNRCNIRLKCSETNSQLKNEIQSEPAERIKFSFVAASGEEIEVEGEIGKTILSVAQDYDVGVDGACEGQLACTTCHVYVDENYEQVFPEADKMEEDMLDIAHFLKPNSRLSCQLFVSKEIEGAKFKLPPGTANFYVDGKKPAKH